MDVLKKGAEDFKEEFRTDATINSVKHYAKVLPPKAIPGTKEYLVSKVPIVQWLPRYNLAWLAQDFMAGLTIGVMLIPQGLSYAKIATIPIENGLYSSWIPAALYVIMGSTKDMSSGPTSMLGLLTSEIISSLKNDYTPTEISCAVAFMVGVYALVVGFLELGFLLDFVSAPVLTGFISATALTIGFGQVGSLVGLDDTPDNIFRCIGYVLRYLPDWDGPTCGVGFGSMAILIALEQVGKRYGNKHYAIRYLASSRAVIVMVIFTLISYLVNRGRSDSDYAWDVCEVDTKGIGTPKVPDSTLIGKVAPQSFAPFIACALEHLAVGKAFGRKNHYEMDQSQELNFLGVSNIVNSFFSVMPTGGAMSRTAVNSECRVRSPLYGIVTAAWIVLTLFVFSPALYWLPKATLAAIIIMAVVHLFGPVSLFYRYWRISLADFVALNITFWITIFLTAEYGIGGGVAWSILWTLLRIAFSRPSVATNSPPTCSSSSTSPTSSTGDDNTNNNSSMMPNPGRRLTHDGHGTESASFPIPDDTAVVSFTDSVFFPNAYRGKNAALERLRIIYPAATYTSSSSNPDPAGGPPERIWSVASERRLERLRAEHGELLRDSTLAVVVWDLSMVGFVDTTGIVALSELKDDVHRMLGQYVQVRMVGVMPAVRRKFARAGWKLRDWEGDGDDEESGNDYGGGQDGEKKNGGGQGRRGGEVVGDVVYPTLEKAVLDRESFTLRGVKTMSEKVN